MKLERVGSLTLRYGSSEGHSGHEGDGQYRGRLLGTLEGDELSGELDLTNRGQFRADGILTPTLRGLLTTPDGARLYATLDGLSLPDDGAGEDRRIVLTAMTLRTGDDRYKKWNSVLFLFEGRGGPDSETWAMRGSLFRCDPTPEDLAIDARPTKKLRRAKPTRRRVRS